MPEGKNEEKKQVHKIDVLVEGAGGELMFKTVEVTGNDIRELLEVTRNPVVAYNLEKELKEKKIKV